MTSPLLIVVLCIYGVVSTLLVAGAGIYNHYQNKAYQQLHEARLEDIERSNTYLSHLKMAMWNLRQNHEKLNTARAALKGIGRDEFPAEVSRSVLKAHWEHNRKNALRVGSTI